MARKSSLTHPAGRYLVISSTPALADFCKRQARAGYVTIDTEFIRDKTFWPQLCLVQIAGPDEAAAVDSLAPGIELGPLLELLTKPAVLKVFHAARQDIEIFFHLAGIIPQPLFDTQVAAMVCGFGESAAYETLVAKLTGERIDKTSRFTDWARRPLSERQLSYAIADVTLMRPIYERFCKRLESSGRAAWLEEEMAVISDPATYRLDPRTAWMRLKSKSTDRRYLAVLRELAAWREEEAMRRDLPRGRVLRDAALLEIARQAPQSAAQLARSRGLPRGYAASRAGRAVLAVVRRGLAVPDADRPQPPAKPQPSAADVPVIELMKVLLKQKCEAHRVAQKLVASADDLMALAADDGADVPALHGWRYQVFGADALALKQGRLGLALSGRKIELIELAARDQAEATTAHGRK
ncbi:MAG: ribonuclease D [Kiloniellales bacterium]